MFDNPDLFKKFGKIYEQGKVIFCEYEKGEELYFIISGRVKISKITRESEKILAYLGAGEFLGEMAIFDNKPRTATVITEEETKVLVLRKDDFYKLMQVAPNLVVELIKTLSIRYINTEKQLNNLMTEDPEKRLINYMCEKCLNADEKIRRIDINLQEMTALLNMNKDDIIGRLGSYQKRGYLKIGTEIITLTDVGWWAGFKGK